jgi:hypothetical protein
MTLSSRDKSPTAWGGATFHHVEPQRRLPTVMGDLLVPASADDIPPVTAEAMASFDAAIDLLAAHLTDRDFLIFFGDIGTPREDEAKREARAASRIKDAVHAILRVVDDPDLLAACPRCGTPGLEVDAQGCVAAHLAPTDEDGRDAICNQAKP